jgi:UDP-N-acetylglucosamine/UDP-N-acetyl-alpha-D-glucosaminouronate 4-epimerase
MAISYLVTGGAGFIGSHIVEALVKKGERVRVLDNFATGKRENIAPFIDDVELFEGDLRNLREVRKAVGGVEVVLHQGALPSVPKSVEDPAGSNESNITGTLHVLIASRDGGVKRVVYAASSSAYGDSPTLPKEETMKPEPRSPYAIQKYVGELYCRNFYELYGLETVSLRYFNVFGPRQDPNSQYAAVIPKFITALAGSRPPTIYGDGEQSRDFTYVENVVQANLLAAQAEGVAGEMMNFACGKRYTLNGLLRQIQEIMQTDIEPVYTDPRPGDVKHSLADIRKSQRLLGYTSHVPLEEGLRQTVAFFCP